MFRSVLQNLLVFKTLLLECARVEQSSILSAEDAGNPEVAGPASVEEAIAAVFHPKGVYLVNKEGGHTLVHDENWIRTESAIAIGRSEVLAMHPQGSFTMQVAPPRASYSKFASDTWHFGGPMLRTPQEPTKPLVFHNQGIYRFDPSARAATKVGNEKWSLARAVVYTPERPDEAVIFHDQGLYRVDLNSFESTKIHKSFWTYTKAVVYDPERKDAFVFHSHATYRVNLQSGDWEKVNNENWADCKFAVYSHGRFAFALHNKGAYQVNMDDGTWTKLTSDTWWRVPAAVPLGENSWFSNHGWVDTKNGPSHA